MNRKRVVATAMLAGVLTGVVGVLPVFTSVAVAQDEKKAENKNAVRPDMGKHLAPAQQLIKDKKLGPALAEIQQADDMADKTQYEKYVIAALRETIYAQQNDAPNVAKAAEAMIATGFVPQADILKQEGIVARVYFGAKDYAKAIDFANRYYRDGGTDETYHQIIMNAQYLSGNTAEAIKTLRTAIATEERQGQKPSEEQLTNLMGFEYKVQPSSAGYLDALMKVTQLYPKKDYWHDLILTVEQRPGITDLDRLDLDKLKLLNGQFTAPTNYMEAAQSALEAGLPGDAKMFMDKGFADNILGQGTDAARHKRLADMASKQTVDDQKVLAQEAASAKTGTLLFKLGNAYLSYAQYDQAASAFDAAIKNGTFKTPEEAGLARVHLGVAYLKLGNKPKAKDALGGVTSPDQVANIARLWAIYGGVR